MAIHRIKRFNHGIKRHRAAAISVLLIGMTGSALADERADIEAACTRMGLEDCGCIADHAVSDTTDPVRALVLLSLRDEVGFTIRAQSGEFADDDIRTLSAFQQTVVSLCGLQDDLDTLDAQ